MHGYTVLRICSVCVCVGGGGFEAVWGLSVHVCEINKHSWK